MSNQKPPVIIPPLPTQEGLVVSYFGNSVAVEAQAGQVFPCHLRKNQPLPVVGDRVLFTLDADQKGIVTAIVPRRSVLVRGEIRGDNTKPIAANVDVIVIVMAPPPIFTEHLIDRYLVAAELLSIPAILVLNKVDLLNAETTPAAEARLAPYRQIPCPVVLSSIYVPGGLSTLTQALAGKTAVLVGPSGVGKSSIINALGSQVAIETREVTGKGIGKHTTTTTRLYHIPNGGHLIDSPGVREFNLWPVCKAEVLRGFKEFHAATLPGCKFRDCAHTAEPGCAVQDAVASGKIHPSRYASYQELMKKIATKS